MSQAHDPRRVPPVSVVMPVHNAGPFLDAAIRSILAQTFADFEFVIGDDASTDGSSEWLADWARRDPRIRLQRRSKWGGPASSSNWVVAMARSPIIARMDADDVSAPHRLEAQLSLLRARPDLILVGSLWEGIDASDQIISRPQVASLFDRKPLTFPWAHGSVMFRRSAFDKCSGYREHCDYWEDADLFHRMSGLGAFAIFVEPLYKHRFTTASNRLTVDMDRLVRQHRLRAECCSALRKEGDYEQVLERNNFVENHRIPLMPFQKRACLAVRAGVHAPQLFEWIALGRDRRGAFTLPEIGYLILAAVSPRMLRFLLDITARARGLAYRSDLKDARIYEWM
jgi:glycosyltransferase involved in cell wall biosynthesis